MQSTTILQQIEAPDRSVTFYELSELCNDLCSVSLHIALSEVISLSYLCCLQHMFLGWLRRNRCDNLRRI